MSAMLAMLLALSVGDSSSQREPEVAWREEERAWRESFKEANKDFKSKTPEAPAKARRVLPPEPKTADGTVKKKSPPLDWQLQPGDDSEWRAGGRYAIRETASGFQPYRILKGKLVPLGKPWDSLLDAGEVAERDAAKRELVEASKLKEKHRAVGAKQVSGKHSKNGKATKDVGSQERPLDEHGAPFARRIIVDPPKPQKLPPPGRAKASGGIF